jgi:isocitrate dehydrogenase
MFNGYESSRKIKIVDLPQDTLTIINKMKVETKGPMKLKKLARDNTSLLRKLGNYGEKFL